MKFYCIYTFFLTPDSCFSAQNQGVQCLFLKKSDLKIFRKFFPWIGLPQSNVSVAKATFLTPCHVFATFATFLKKCNFFLVYIFDKDFYVFVKNIGFLFNILQYFEMIYVYIINQIMLKKDTIPPNFALKNTNPALKKFLDAVKLHKNVFFGRSSVKT